MIHPVRTAGALCAAALAITAAPPSIGTVHPAPSRPSIPAASCEALKALQLPNVEIVSARFVEAGPGAASLPTLGGSTTVDLAAHCVVAAIARPTSDSAIGIEIWLPARGWNGKYQQIGNGGWAGAVHRRPLAGALQRGYVAAATDNGHQDGITDDGRGKRSAEFAIGHPEKLIDFGYRALGETREVALAAIRAYYGRGPEWSYFVGCSDGGREAMMVAQRFPEAFNGILAGNPGNNWTRWAAGLVWNQQAQLAGTAGAIPKTKRALIQSAVVKACDTTDGVKDGLISDPRFCRFDPAVLACKGPDAADCLTSAQVDTLRKIYQGPQNPRTGERIFAGFPAGLENAPGSSLITPAELSQFSFGTSYFGQALFEKADWDFRTLDFDEDIAFSDRKGSPVLDAVNPDLRSFRAHGGKLLHYQGWSDALMPAGGAIAYHDAVATFMRRFPDPRVPRRAPLEDFYRLFLIPGMGHCYGGDGPTTIADGNSSNPRRDLLRSLELWTEKGIVPDYLIGTGRVPGSNRKTMSRPICPFPAATRYKGTGDTNLAENFECVAKAAH